MQKHKADSPGASGLCWVSVLKTAAVEQQIYRSLSAEKMQQPEHREHPLCCHEGRHCSLQVGSVFFGAQSTTELAS